MRITGGSYCGRTIICPKGVIRPAMDRMRESQFSILGNITGCSFLDLFSGSGCVGIEAASRGASPIVLVEKDYKKKGVILKNIDFVKEDINLKMMSAEKFMKITNYSFDYIYLDPPFPMKNKIKLVEIAVKEELLKKRGKLIIHYPAEEKWPEMVGSLRVVDKRVYGRSILLFFEQA